MTYSVISVMLKIIKFTPRRQKPLIDDGGFVPMLDHSAPPDIPYRNYCYFMEQLRKIL